MVGFEYYLPNSTFMTTVAVSATAWTILLFLGRVFSRLCVESYRKEESIAKDPMTKSDNRKAARAALIDWDSRIVSNFHAFVTVIAGCMSTYAMVTSKGPLAYARSPNDSIVSGIICGYLLYDFVLISYHRSLFGPAIAMHHVVGMWLYYVCEYFSIFRICTHCFMITEITTPFINNISFFRVVNMPKDSSLQIVNAILLWVSWFVVRILGNIVFVKGILIDEHNLIWAPTIHPVPRVTLYFGYSFMAIVNIFWFVKITMGMLPFIIGKKSDSGDSKKGQEAANTDTSGGSAGNNGAATGRPKKD